MTTVRSRLAACAGALALSAIATGAACPSETWPVEPASRVIGTAMIA